MFFNGRIIITVNSFSSECRNSQVVTHSEVKMTISFSIIGSIEATTLKVVNNVRTYDRWNFVFKYKKVILHLVWITNWILQYGSLVFIMGLILVRI